MSNINTCRTDCTDTKWVKYCNMPQIRDNETPSEWMKQIWLHLQYFRKNDLLPIEIKKKSISGYDYDNKYALHRYGLWIQNAIKKIECAREIGKKIQA
ncbi:43714_t:CDS:2, partial [Gigaspora margarita]